jgi:hypothetical protein
VLVLFLDNIGIDAFDRVDEILEIRRAERVEAFDDPVVVVYRVMLAYD